MSLVLKCPLCMFWPLLNYGLPLNLAGPLCSDHSWSVLWPNIFSPFLISDLFRVMTSSDISPGLSSDLTWVQTILEGFIQKRMQRSSLLAILTTMIWRNGWISNQKKKMDLPVGDAIRRCATYGSRCTVKKDSTFSSCSLRSLAGSWFPILQIVLVQNS